VIGMAEILDFQVKKLSATIEELCLDRRAYHGLKRAKIARISDIISRGEAGILGLRNMGPLTTSHIVSTVASYLNLPPEKLFSEEIKQAALSLQDRPFNPLTASIAILDLPFSTIRSLQELNVFSINDLLKLKSDSMELDNGYRIGNLPYPLTRRIYSRLNLYLAKNNLDGDQRIDQNVLSNDLAEEKRIEETNKSNDLKLSDLNTFLTLVFRKERYLRIVELRAIHLLTLEEIATAMGGVSRERIRQIIDQVHERIRTNLDLVIIFCDYLEEGSRCFHIRKDNNCLLLNDFVDQMKLQLVDSPLTATDHDLETLIAVIRLLVLHDKLWIHDLLQKRWKRITFFSCLVDPAIKKHHKIGKLLRQNKEKNKKLSYKEIAYLILRDEKAPLHWSEIVKRAFRFGHRDSMNPAAIYNALMDESKFVRVEAGTYGLTEWGLTQVDTFPDIIASILRTEKKPLPIDTIYQKVQRIRSIKPNTLTTVLEAHPRFYKSLEKTYGLRVWLPSREQQTLRTPEALVENNNSFKRLQSAAQRGYDVENILKADLD
jgi:DNA-directed RNA polymerase delta subunit